MDYWNGLWGEALRPCIFGCYSRLRISLLHGARFARKIFFHYTCRWVFLLFPHAFFIYRCYSHLRIFLLHGARSARKISFNYTCHWLFRLPLDALLVLRCYSNLRVSLLQASFTTYFCSITFVVGCFIYFRMIYLFVHVILVFEYPYFTELASLVTYLSIPLLIKFLRTFKCFIHLWMLFWFINLTSRSSLRSRNIF